MINVKINGLNKLSKIAEKYPAVSEKYINTAISRSLLRIWGQEKQEAPFGVGGLLRENWQTSFGRFEGFLKALSPYAVFVHEGTRPHMPPVDALAAWAKKKGINPWAVAKSIAKKGTKANPFLQRAVDKTARDVEGEFKRALDGTMEELGQLNDTI